MKNKDLIQVEMEKRHEIVNNFQKNYLLEAGAGAGKTTIIVERIINHIVFGDMNPSNLVAITFTKAAATELAERIQIKALERLEGESDPQIRQRLRDVDKIFTGTIHSFADLILREMPFHADLSPGYEIVEDAESFHEDIWYSFLRDREEAYKDKMEGLYQLGIDYMELKPKALIALENTDVHFTGYTDGDYDFDSLKEDFQEIIEDYGDLAFEDVSRAKAIGKLVYGVLQSQGEFTDYLNLFKNAFAKGQEDIEVFFQEIHKQGSEFEDQERYKDFMGALLEFYGKLNALPFNLATDFINMVVAYKKENYRGNLTFNELLYRAAEVVKNSEEARAHLKSKYKYFYLDESQDTDPMQIELIMYLVHGSQDYEGVETWYDVEPQPGSLFIVGDPKQSIYRFRRADISIYNKMKDLVDKYGEVVYLDINFRSSDMICDWVQDTFRINEKSDFGFGEEATDSQAGFKRILSLWDDSLGDGSPYADFHLQGVYKYDLGENEEERVGDMIYKLRQEGIITEKIRDGDSYINNYRKVEYGDIMVLTKTNAETGMYLNSLKKRGIPALLAGEKSLGETREVINLFSLIDALVDFEDNIKIVGALRNAFYLDLETIQFFMEEEKNLSKFMFSDAAIETIDHESLKKAFSYINKINRLSEEYSPLAFVEMLIEERFGVYDVGKDYTSLETRDADASLRQVVEMLKTREVYSLYSLRQELDDLVFNKVGYELPIDKEEATGALRIMNIHKAKGLEANIVILAGGDKTRYSFPDSHYVEKNKANETLGYMKYKSSFNTKGPREDYKGERETDYKEAELDRLLYVAATRAQAVLIVADAQEEKAFLNPLAENIDREMEIQEEFIVDRVEEISKEKIMERKLRQELRIQKEIFPASYTLSSPSRFSSSIYFGSKKEDSRNLKIKTLKIKDASWTQMTKKISFNFGPRGKFYGTIVHEAIEDLILGTEGLKNGVQARIDYSARSAVDLVIDNMEINKTNIGLFYPGQSLKVGKIIDLSLVQGREKAADLIKTRLYSYVKDVLNKFVSNEEIKELFQNADRIFPELPFTIALNERDKDTFEKILGLMEKKQAEEIRKHKQVVLINGVIDLVVESKDGRWIILDYKTDRPLVHKDNLPAYLKRAYGNQLKGYKILFEKVLEDEGIRVGEICIYSTYLDEVVGINILERSYSSRFGN